MAWTIDEGQSLNFSTYQTQEIENRWLRAEHIGRVKVILNDTNGSLSFDVSQKNLTGYISTTTSFDDFYGEPDALYSFTGSFSFTPTTTEYYFWWRETQGINIDDEFSVYVSFSSSSGESNWSPKIINLGELSSTISRAFSTNAGQLSIINFELSSSQQVSLQFVNSNHRAMIAFSDKGNYNPSDGTVSSNDAFFIRYLDGGKSYSSDSYNLSSKPKKYYIFFRAADIYDTGLIDISIILENSPIIEEYYSVNVDDTNKTVTITVNNPVVSNYIAQITNQTTQNIYTLQLSNQNNYSDTQSSLSSGHYSISVYSSGYGYIVGPSGSRTYYFDITSSPSPSNWRYLFNTVNVDQNFSNNYDIMGPLYCQAFFITFANTGQARFYSYNSAVDITAYISDSIASPSSYNYNTGIPYDYDRSSRLRNGFNLDSYSVTAGTTYYLWVKYQDSQSNVGTRVDINIDFINTEPILTPPNYSVTSTTNSITFSIVANDYNYCCCYVRKASETNAYNSGVLNMSSGSQTYTQNGLQSNTTYVVNVSYGNTSSIDSTWDYCGQITISTQEITGYVYIFTGSRWQKAIPYIYTGSGANQGWKQAIPYIFDGSTWRQCGE